jgi:hypothetical protein
VKGVKFGRRMQPSLEIQTRCFGVSDSLRRNKNIGNDHLWCMERYMRDGQYAGGLRRNHRLAAIVTLIGRVAGHGTAALHALLVLGYRGHAVRKLQTQQGNHDQNYE